MPRCWVFLGQVTVNFGFCQPALYAQKPNALTELYFSSNLARRFSGFNFEQALSLRKKIHNKIGGIAD
ncbi:MAG: hypothetical protein IPM82_02165 [Saprospiraceae bacterium]|nr:hypothetical protein [Saprospiraceae bacterium]